MKPTLGGHRRYHLSQRDKVYYLNFVGDYGIQQQNKTIIQTLPVDLLAEIFLLSLSARLPPVIRLTAEFILCLQKLARGRSWPS